MPRSTLPRESNSLLHRSPAHIKVSPHTNTKSMKSKAGPREVFDAQANTFPHTYTLMCYCFASQTKGQLPPKHVYSVLFLRTQYLYTLVSQKYASVNKSLRVVTPTLCFSSDLKSNLVVMNTRFCNKIHAS